MITRLSAVILRVERMAAGVLAALILALVGAGSLARTFGYPLRWSDELAVHLMVMLAFIAASAGVALQNHMAMGLFSGSAHRRLRHWLARANQIFLLLFLGAMAWLTHLWLDLPGLWAAGSGAALAEQSFNFAWTDPTLTLGLRKIWFWLVVPISTLCALIHAGAHLSAEAPL